MVYALGHISGAHFNPAVTMAFAVARHFPVREVLVYCAAQILGGLAAVAFLAALFPGAVAFGVTIPSVGFAPAFAWEVSLTFFLMFVIISVATDTRAVGTMAGVAIGAIVTACIFIGSPMTGASMNPARSLAPALFQGEMSSFWIYGSAPFVGAIAAALFYEAIRCDGSKKSGAKGCC